MSDHETDVGNIQGRHGTGNTPPHRTLPPVCPYPCERWIARQAAWTDSVRIARLEARRDTLEADLAARTRLLRAAQVAVDSLESQRDQWRKEAHRGRWGLGISLGPAVGPDGFQVATVQVGVQYRFR